MGIRLINLSMGHRPGESYRTDPLCAAVRRAVQAGIVVVCAAGNDGKNASGVIKYGGIHCPGNEPSAKVAAPAPEEGALPLEDLRRRVRTLVRP